MSFTKVVRARGACEGINNQKLFGGDRGLLHLISNKIITLRENALQQINYIIYASDQECCHVGYFSTAFPSLFSGL